MLVIGNGESRKGIDIDSLNGPKIGCNAIYRDFSVNHLICADKRMMKEVLDAGVNNNSLVYTREDWWGEFGEKKRTRMVPKIPYGGMEKADLPINWGSGPYAVLLAATLSPCVHLIGFDLYSKDKKINNVYKGTKNYEAEEKRAIDPSYWIYQIGKVFECFPKVKFTIYQEEGWQRPKAWNKANVKVDKISNISYNM
jgi:hypothetical protein